MYNQPYNYNQYIQPRYNQPQMPQPTPTVNDNLAVQPFGSVQNRPVLNGKQVESIDVVKAMDIPMDGTVSYFPIADGSAIVTKQLQMDGTSKTIIYKPTTEATKDKTFVTFDEFEKSLKNIDLSEIDDLKEEIKDLKQEIKELKKKKKDD